MPTRLTGMLYDEVSVVDAGANNDDAEGAHIVLMKRHAEVSEDEIVDFGKAFVQTDGSSSAAHSSSTKSSSKSGRKRGTSQRAQNWNSSRHPRVPKGKSGGGEFASSSSQSKKKYGKGGTAKDNLAANSLKLKLTPAEQKLANQAAKSGGGGGSSKSKKSKKSGGRTSSASSAKGKRQSALKTKAGRLASEINSMDATQRAAYRKEGRPLPPGYAWDYNNHVITKERARLERGLPHDKKSSTSSSSSKPKMRMEMVMDSNGKISWKMVPVGAKDHGKLTGKKNKPGNTSPKKSSAQKATSRRRRRGGNVWQKGGQQREYVKKGARQTALEKILYSEGSTTS